MLIQQSMPLTRLAYNVDQCTMFALHFATSAAWTFKKIIGQLSLATFLKLQYDTFGYWNEPLHYQTIAVNVLSNENYRYEIDGPVAVSVQ